ncbi:MAG: alpha/beta hydrolase [marine bacterium B5-7]|nr:MAG: alpha/beta hydrolase [marine bacterium B5-7]
MSEPACPSGINLALQGGGAHGAFTWGILDRLLEDGRLDIEAISGTSAGAMNAVVLCHGYVADGRDGARQSLNDFWKSVSDAAQFSPIRRSAIDMFMGNWSLDTSPAFMFFDILSRVASPYDLNPLNINPLRDLLESIVDFEKLQKAREIRLFIAATNVHTGRVRVFRCAELTADCVMASACLPFLFQAVEIDGIPYWDGGFMGNPVLYPFFYECKSKDILLVQINPTVRNETPKSAREILNRMNEITFNSSLMKELRAVEFVGRLIDEGHIDEGYYRKIFMHVIHGDEALREMSASSKVNAEWLFLTTLRDLGRQTAKAWLEKNLDLVGTRSSVDLRQFFQGPQ